MKQIRENAENENDGNINVGLGNDCQVEYRYFYIFSYVKTIHMMDIFLYLKSYYTAAKIFISTLKC